MFVQSSIWNASEDRDPATIQSILPGSRSKIFNKIRFSLKLQEWTNSNGRFFVCRNKFFKSTLDYNRVAQMVNDCKIRVSFVFAIYFPLCLNTRLANSDDQFCKGMGK